MVQLDAAALAALTPEQLRMLSLKLLANHKLMQEGVKRKPRQSWRPASSVAPPERAGDNFAAPELADDESAGATAGTADPEAGKAPARVAACPAQRGRPRPSWLATRASHVGPDKAPACPAMGAFSMFRSM